MRVVKKSQDLVILKKGPKDAFTQQSPAQQSPIQQAVFFDLDHTIVKPKGDNIHAKDPDDWAFVIPRDTMLKAGCVVVFTNQGGIAKSKYTIEDLQKRLENIFEGFTDVLCFAAIGQRYRKPYPCMMWEFNKMFGNVAAAECCFIGDAAGRPGDFSDSDLKFAHNCGMQFQTPEEFTSNFESQDRKLITSTEFINYCKTQHTPTVTFEPQEFPVLTGKTLVIAVGSPASGKSTYLKRFVAHATPNSTYIINQDTAHKTRTGEHKPASKAECVKILKTFVSNLEKTINLEKTADCEKTTVTPRYTICLDATHPDKKSREEYIKITRENKLNVVCFNFKTSREICDLLNNIRCMQGGRYVPPVSMAVFRKKYEEPDAASEFDRVVNIEKIYWDADPKLLKYLF